ncbi:MAG: hypothetical protein BWK76_12395 [Desulfobulbaceae bacterium A2]|nr:MAG: hypothetical protein BWK76_12395 [Desulfobulbaceae bacterium A2]
MQIRIDNDVLELRPENPQETGQLETLWRKLVDCLGDNRRLNPIGEYIPLKDNVARFFVELPGGSPAAAHGLATATVAEGCTLVCTVCNKYLALQNGDEVPLCCGRPMESVD